jgi:hypothetical protein
MTNKMADYVVKTCFGTDEKDRFLSNLKLYRSYIEQDAEITSFIDIHYYCEFQEYHHYFIQKIVTGHFSDIRILISWVTCNLLISQ